MKCPSCQTPKSSADRYCGHCGADFDSLKTTTPVVGVAVNGLSGKWQQFLVVFVSLGIAVLLLQNFYLLSSFKQLLNNVTVAQLPDQTQMVPYPYNSGPSTEPTAPNANNATKNNPYENDAAMLFAALMTPCKKCNRPLASNDCDHPHGAKVTKELIYQMLAAGKGKSEIVGYFVKTYGIDVLTPQAKAIYQQRHKNS